LKKNPLISLNDFESKNHNNFDLDTNRKPYENVLENDKTTMNNRKINFNEYSKNDNNFSNIKNNKHTKNILKEKDNTKIIGDQKNPTKVYLFIFLFYFLFIFLVFKNLQE
jgi:hypothetical protein